MEEEEWGIREHNIKLAIIIIFLAVTAFTVYTVIQSLSSIDKYIFKYSAMNIKGIVECDRPVFRVKSAGAVSNNGNSFNFMDTFKVKVEFQQFITVHYGVDGDSYNLASQVKKSSESIISSQDKNGAIQEAKNKLAEKYVYSSGQRVDILVSKINPGKAMLLSEYKENRGKIWAGVAEAIGAIILQIIISIILYRNRSVDRFNDEGLIRENKEDGKENI